MDDKKATEIPVSRLQRPSAAGNAESVAGGATLLQGAAICFAASSTGSCPLRYCSTVGCAGTSGVQRVRVRCAQAGTTSWCNESGGASGGSRKLSTFPVYTGRCEGALADQCRAHSFEFDGIAKGRRKRPPVDEGDHSFSFAGTRLQDVQQGTKCRAVHPPHCRADRQ